MGPAIGNLALLSNFSHLICPFSCSTHRDAHIPMNDTCAHILPDREQTPGWGTKREMPCDV